MNKVLKHETQILTGNCTQVSEIVSAYCREHQSASMQGYVIDCEIERRYADDTVMLCVHTSYNGKERTEYQVVDEFNPHRLIMVVDEVNAVTTIILIEPTSNMNKTRLTISYQSTSHLTYQYLMQTLGLMSSNVQPSVIAVNKPWDNPTTVMSAV